MNGLLILPLVLSVTVISQDTSVERHRCWIIDADALNSEELQCPGKVPLYRIIHSAAQAQNFCEQQACEQQPPTPTTCCIWRFYINTCPIEQSYTDQSTCGPWLPINGIIVGGTVPQYGIATKEVWNASIPGSSFS
ncbi:hypothetical protein ACTXT7_005951 [Hymenolepis weldensis]